MNTIHGFVLTHMFCNIWCIHDIVDKTTKMLRNNNSKNIFSSTRYCSKEISLPELNSKGIYDSRSEEIVGLSNRILTNNQTRRTFISWSTWYVVSHWSITGKCCRVKQLLTYWVLIGGGIAGVIISDRKVFTIWVIIACGRIWWIKGLICSEKNIIGQREIIIDNPYRVKISEGWGELTWIHEKVSLRKILSHRSKILLMKWRLSSRTGYNISFMSRGENNSMPVFWLKNQKHLKW